MRLTSYSLLAAAAALALAACDRQADGDNAAATGNAAEAAGDATIADGLTGDRRFAEAAKSAGLDRTLDGPGPYTVLVPSDAAFEKLPAGAAYDWVGIGNCLRSARAAVARLSAADAEECVA